MEDAPRFWPAQIDRHLQRVADEIGTHVLCHGEADDAPGGEVDHGREVGPALPAGDALPTGALVLMAKLVDRRNRWSPTRTPPRAFTLSPGEHAVASRSANGSQGRKG